MNDEYNKNGTLTGPLIFTVPAYGFVMALYHDWLGQSNRAALSAKTFAEEVETLEPVRPGASYYFPTINLTVALCFRETSLVLHSLCLKTLRKSILKSHPPDS
jgi:hypothetical protein